MKNYYYFLGVDEDASEEQIKKAYRKLSLKYHPDKNDNDDFFADRFREVNEAYETLVDSERRRAYDQGHTYRKKSTQTNLPPFIKSFSVSQTTANKGDEIIVKWNAMNADVVKVLPFGLEKPFGERRFKITEFKEGKFHVVLHITNTKLNKTQVQGITITEEKSTLEEVLDQPFRPIYTRNGIASNSRILILILVIISIFAFLITVFN